MNNDSNTPDDVEDRVCEAEHWQSGAVVHIQEDLLWRGVGSLVIQPALECRKSELCAGCDRLRLVTADYHLGELVTEHREKSPVTGHEVLHLVEEQEVEWQTRVNQSA